MPRWLTASITLFAFLLLTLPAGHALAQNPPGPAAVPPPPPADQAALDQAKAHFEAGRNAYLAKDYPGSIREFKAAQALRPSPILDYNIGLAYEGMGRPRAAAKFYHRYLEGKPDAQNRAEVEQKIGALEQQANNDAAAAQQNNQPPPPSATVEEGPAPPPVQQPQYQYANDPYGSYGQPYQQQPPPPAPKKKSSHWWIVFPIVGGALLITILVVWYVAVYSAVNTTYYATGALGTLPPVGGGARANEPGVLFRF
jgi:tetratricopeptide (TPR) repeat protein